MRFNKNIIQIFIYVIFIIIGQNSYATGLYRITDNATEILDKLCPEKVEVVIDGKKAQENMSWK